MAAPPKKKTISDANAERRFMRWRIGLFQFDPDRNFPCAGPGPFESANLKYSVLTVEDYLVGRYCFDEMWTAIHSYNAQQITQAAIEQAQAFSKFIKKVNE